ncbi:MAG TPA: hypothetical protein PK765_03320 [bacterium]|nr:hypothetical protein [bacterium]
MDNREGNWASQNGYESVHVEKNTLDRRPDLGTTVRSAAANLCPTSDVMEIVQALENLRKSGLVRMGQLISEYKEDQPKVQEFLGEPLKTQGLNGKFLGIIPVEYARDLRAIQAIVRTGIESASRDPSIRETEISLMERTLSSFSELYRGSGLGETRILYLGMGYWCVAMGQKA